MSECFLVVITTTYDDLPVRLLPTEAEAREWAAKCDSEAEADKVSKQRGIIAGGNLLFVRLQRFLNGVPVSDDIVRDLETEDDEIGGAS